MPWPQGDIVAHDVAGSDGFAQVRIGPGVDGRGNELLDLIEEALAEPKVDNQVRTLKRLAFQYEAVLRHKGVLERLEKWRHDGMEGAIAQIMGEAHRGRPQTCHLPTVRMVDELRKEGYSIERASIALQQKCMRHLTPERIRKVYYEWKPVFERCNRGYALDYEHFLPAPTGI